MRLHDLRTSAVTLASVLSNLPDLPHLARRARAVRLGMPCGYAGRAMRASSRTALVVLAFLTVGCKEEGTIKVHSLKFNGVKAVDAGRLKDALATKQSSRIPWGKKAYFDRSR